VAFFACNKYADTNYPSDTTPVEDHLVTASLQGRVLDEKGVPVQGASVTSGTATTTTDVNGVFFFTDISLYARFGTVNVSYQGYFMGSRTFVTSTSGLNYVEIHLLPRAVTGTFDASAGGTINLAGGQSVIFTGGSVVNAATNATYSGTVHVYTAYLDPTQKESLMSMPGDLRGITTDKKEVVLRSYGMMKVELEGDAGEKLQIATGKTATLNFAIPSSLQSDAPDSLPLWHFADSTGKWMQEGKAAKTGNSYVGQVSHFSWWNIDGYYTAVLLKARFKDQNGRSIAQKWAYLEGNAVLSTGRTINLTTVAVTDSTGAINVYVPIGEVLQVKIEDMCGNMVGGVNVGPLVSNQDVGTITMQLDDVMLNLSGTVVDCSNNPVTNGYVNIYVDNLTYRAAVANGNFSMAIHRCYSAATTAQFIAVDNSGSQQGSMTSQSVTKGDVNVGVLSACGVSSTEFINMIFNGTTYSFSNPPDVFTYNSGVIVRASGTSPVSKRVDLTFSGGAINGTGSFTPTWFTLNYGNFNGGSAAYAQTPAVLNVTAFGPVNGFITGTFGGTIADSTSMQVYPLSGSFKIKRTN
jgi:hypothetical protein